MINLFKALVIVALISINLNAETSVEATPATQAASPLLGELDVRPTVEYKNEGDTSEFLDATATIGYKFSPTVDLSYLQEVMLNIHQMGQDAKIGVSYFRLNVNDLYKDDSGNSFRYQARAYLPTNPDDARGGYLGEVRNYLWYTHEFSSFYKLSFAEAPIFYFHNKAGFVDGDGDDFANYWFKNRFVIEQSFQLAKNLSFTFPILVDAARTRNFGDEDLANTWHTMIWVYPDITYTLSSNLSLGLAWRNDYAGFVSQDFKKFTFNEAFEQGAFELFLTASL